MVNILPYQDKKPTIHPSVFLAPGVILTGDVRLHENVSFWINSAARGDVNFIEVGRNTNIQDFCMLHVTEETALTIGQDVTVGHHVMLHGCKIGNRCLIGMGAIILDRAQIGDECLIAAGTLITERTVIPDGSLVMGSPGKIKRALTLDERKQLIHGSKSYATYAQEYLKTPGFPPCKPTHK